MRRTLLWCLAFAAVMLPLEARAEVRGYELTVRGLGCTFRAHGLERELLRLEGVRTVTLHLADSRVSIALAEHAAVMPAHVEESVRKAGLSLEGIEATAAGTVRGSRLVLGTGRALGVRSGPASEALAALVAAGKRSVEIRGPVVRDGDGWTIEAREVIEAPPATEGTR